MHHNGNGTPSDGRGTGTADPYDALADLFLGDVPVRGPNTASARPDPQATNVHAAAPRASAAAIECIVLGHLPVLGAPWAAQYARTLAQTTGAAVGVATLRGGHLTIEVVGGEGVSAPQSIDPADAARRAAGLTARWVVRTDEPVGDLASNPHLSALTLLTAGDQASIVGSYAAIKRLLDEPGSEGKTIRLAIMATAPEAADSAYARLAEAVRSFAGRAVERAPGAPRIAPSGPAAVLFSGPAAMDAAALAALIADAARGPAPIDRAAPRPTGPARETEPTPPARTDPPAASAELALASLVPGLSPVGARCPYAPEVELACGPGEGQAGKAAETGGLHLLVRGGPGALEALAAAAAWARVHAALLRSAGVAATPDADPHQHIFVDDARTARRLLETHVRVHLLAAASETARTGWLCRPLN